MTAIEKIFVTCQAGVGDTPCHGGPPRKHQGYSGDREGKTWVRAFVAISMGRDG